MGVGNTMQACYERCLYTALPEIVNLATYSLRKYLPHVVKQGNGKVLYAL